MSKKSEPVTLDILVPTLAGPLRGKRIAYDYRKNFANLRLCLPTSTLFLGISGENCETLPYGSEGDPDTQIMPVGDEMPGLHPQRMQQMGQMLDASGNVHPANPRAILDRVAKRLTKRGWQITVACELEFYLLTSTDPIIAFGDNGPTKNNNCYALDELDAIEPTLRLIEDLAKQQSLPIPSVTCEYSAGQFEINLQYQTDALLACDHAVLLKRVIKFAARSHNLDACFLPRPFADRSGNGLHFHIGLRDMDGRNLLAGDLHDERTGLKVSDAFRHAMGGMQSLFGESMLLFAPFANSYRRLGGEYAPTKADYGYEDRRVTLRVPKIQDSADLRFEHRIAGADANPYLAMAAILAAIDHGIEHGLAPQPDGPRVVKRWWQAIEGFSNSTILAEYFGAAVHQDIVALAHHHFDSYHRQIPDLDMRIYHDHC